MHKQRTNSAPVDPETPSKKTEQNIKHHPSSRKRVEVGGPKGPEPTRYGDWEKAGRCSDF